MYIKEADVATTKLRFEVGTRVKIHSLTSEAGTPLPQILLPRDVIPACHVELDMN